MWPQTVVRTVEFKVILFTTAIIKIQSKYFWFLSTIPSGIIPNKAVLGSCGVSTCVTSLTAWNVSFQWFFSFVHDQKYMYNGPSRAPQFLQQLMEGAGLNLALICGVLKYLVIIFHLNSLQLFERVFSFTKEMSTRQKLIEFLFLGQQKKNTLCAFVHGTSPTWTPQ